MVTKENIIRIVDTIVKGFHPEKVILFGSYAAEIAGEDSDIDLLIIRKSEEPRYRRSNAIRKALLGSRVPMDIVVYTPNEYEREKDVRFSFLHNALQNSKVLYERNSSA